MNPQALATGFGAAASAIPEIFKLVQARKDRKLAEKYLNTPRPTYRTPEEVFRAYSRLQNLSGQPLPGYGTMQGNLQAVTSQGARGLQELNPTEAVAGMTSLYGNQMANQRALDMEQATLRRQAQGDLADFETGVLAPYKDQEFDINKFQPYQNAQAAARALLQSSEQNKFGGLTGLSRIGVTAMSQVPDRTTTDINIDDFFGGGSITETDDTGLFGEPQSRFGDLLSMDGDSTTERLRFNYPSLSLPEDLAPYRYRSSPYSYRRRF